MRGTLSSFTLLFVHQVRTRQGLVASTTWVLLLFLLCSLLGRFGVSLLGFAFNLEDSPFYDPPLFRSDWANATLGGDDSIVMALAAKFGDPPEKRGE